MDQLNSIIIEGNLTRDPKLSTTPTRKSVCNFEIGNNRIFKNAVSETVKEVSFFSITCWGKLAESCNSYLETGRSVRVVGRIKQERWQLDNRPHSQVVVIAEHVEFGPANKKVIEG